MGSQVVTLSCESLITSEKSPVVFLIICYLNNIWLDMDNFRRNIKIREFLFNHEAAPFWQVWWEVKKTNKTQDSATRTK